MAFKGPAKPLRHFNATYRNIIGRNVLRAFGHPVARCCKVLRLVACCWFKFHTGQIFHTRFVDIALCRSRLARFAQQCCTRACALVRFSTVTQHVATRRIRVAKRAQHVAPNNAAICCSEMLRSFGRSLQISLDGFVFSGPRFNSPTLCKYPTGQTPAR